MCMIIVKEVDVNLPSSKILNACSISNRDGIGIAWSNTGDNLVHIKKDFDTTEAFDLWIRENIKKEYGAIIHFRMATHGLSDKGNRHPFPISKNVERLRSLELTCQIAVAHNGVMSQYSHKKLSDTQLFIQDILAQDSIRHNIQDETIQQLISQYIGNYNKLSIIYPDGRIDGMGKFYEHKKLYFSNEGYQRTRYEAVIGDYLGQSEYDQRDFNCSIGEKIDNMEKGYEACAYCFKECRRKDMMVISTDRDTMPEYLCQECWELEIKYKHQYGG